MALIERLTGIDYLPAMGARIPVGAFFAMLRERLREQVSNQDIITGFALTAEDTTDLRTVARRIRSNAASYEPPLGDGGEQLLDEFEDVVLLAGLSPYTTVASIRSRLIAS